MMSRGDPNSRIVGAWHSSSNAIRGKTGLFIVYFTELGTAHAGDLRKRWRVPDEAVLPYRPGLDAEPVYKPAPGPKIHPLLVCGDKTLAEAFERLVKEPSFAKIELNDWEFRLAADAPSVFLRWGGFTWKQRKYLREIVKKIAGKWLPQ